MPRVTLLQLLDHAADNGYGLPAFNVNNMEQVLAIMAAADRTSSPVILQASRGARTYAGDAMLIKIIEGAEMMYPHIPVCIHQDHGNDETTCLSAIRWGFTSVMMDGSLEADATTPASYGYNVDITARVVEMAHAVGVSVEGELGCLGSLETGAGEAEDGHGFTGTLDRDALLTDPDQAAEFVNLTGVDALAVAVGTSHGAYKFTRPPDGDVLAMDTVAAIHRACPNTHLVMHGSSSVPTELQEIFRAYGGEMPETYGVPIDQLQRGIANGVRKVNIDTDCRLAMAGQIRRIAAEHPGEFDPRKFLSPSIDAMSDLCADRFEQFGAAGQAPTLGRILSLGEMASHYRCAAAHPSMAAAS